MVRALPLVILVAGCGFSLPSGTALDANDDAFVPDVTSPPLGVDATVDDATPSDALSDAGIDAPPPPDALVDAMPDAPVDAMPDGPPPPDAMPDAGPSGPVLVETLVVPCDGAVITSQPLGAGAYLLRASGQCTVDSFLNIRADAEYQGVLWPRDRENGIDTGLAINDTTLGPLKQPRWGSYASSHVYHAVFTSTGGAFTARYHDRANSAYGNNSGALTLEVFSVP